MERVYTFILFPSCVKIQQYLIIQFKAYHQIESLNVNLFMNYHGVPGQLAPPLGSHLQCVRE